MWFRPVVFAAVRIHALIRVVMSHPADLATPVQLEPENLPDEGVLVGLGLGVGGEQDPAGMLAGGDAAKMWGKPTPAHEGPGDDRRPVRRITIPEEDFLLSVGQSRAGNGGAAGRIGTT